MANVFHQIIQDLQAIAQAANPNETGKKVTLRNIQTEDARVIDSIISTLSVSTFVKSFEIQLGTISELLLNRLMEGLTTSHIILLRIVNVNLTNVSKLTQMIQTSTTCRLIKLDLTWNRIGNEGAIAIANVIPHSDLEMVQLGHNNIDNEGGIALARILNNPDSKLKSLDLRMNNLDDDFIRVLSEEIRNPNCILRVLQLDENTFTYEGFKIFIENVRFSSNLSTLFFGNNHLTDQALQLFAQELPYFQSNLKKVCFNRNYITPVGLKYLQDAIKPIIIHLEHMDFRSNETLTDESVSLLTETIRVQSSMQNILFTPSELLSQETIDTINRQLMFSKSKEVKILLTLASVTTSPRVGRASSLRVLPQEIFRVIGLMLIV